MHIAPIRIPAPVYNHPLKLALIDRLSSSGTELVKKYLAANSRNGIPFIARDAAKLLFTEFRLNPTENNRYSDSVASAIADAARRTLLLRAVKSNRNEVVINTGCPASGKTGAAGPRIGGRVDFEHETIMTEWSRAAELIEQAIVAGRFPIVRLFYTDDPRINVRRMIKRARRIGRTVPLGYMAKTYLRVPGIVQQLGDVFNGRISVLVTNNSDDPDQAVHHNKIERALYHVGRYNEESALEAMHAEFDSICSGPHPLPQAIIEEATRL